jgi:hypothetical protein
MNERIRELAEQAGLRFTQLMSNPMVPVVDGRETDLEKFAELIVEECYESCKGQVLDKETADTNELTYNDAVGDCAIGLLQHFGMME